MTRIGLILTGLLVAAGGAACSHFQPAAHPLYPGPARPPGEVARLSGPVARVDGIEVSNQASSYTLLPGCHVVELQSRIGEGSPSGAWSAEVRHRFYAFKMQAGYSYEIDAQLQPGNDSLGTGTVGGVKIKAVERDTRGTVLGTIAPVRTAAEARACRASADDGVDPEPKGEGPLAPPAPQRQEEQQDKQ